MVVPRETRKYYDTTQKVSGLAEYAGAVKYGAEQLGQAAKDVTNMFSQQQQAKITSALDNANYNIQQEFAKQSPKYDNNPDNPEFKQYMDDYRKNEYKNARQNIMPMFRGDFDLAARDNEVRFNSSFDSWKTKQRQANASNDVKQISAGLINEAYIAGQTGNIEDARAQYNKKVAVIRGISTATLGSRITEQGISDLNKQYLTAYATGAIDSDPVSSEKMLDDKDFIREVGVENVTKLKGYAKGRIEQKKKQVVKEAIKSFNANPTKETLDMIKQQDLVKVSDKTIQNLEDVYKASPNYVCETKEEAIEAITRKMEDFASKDYTINEGENKGSIDVEQQLEDAAELSKFIMSQNSTDGKLSKQDCEEYMNSIAKIMGDENVKNALMNTRSEVGDFIFRVNEYNPLGGLFGRDELYGQAVVSNHTKNVIKNKTRDTINEVMQHLWIGDEDGARDALNAGKQEILYLKYPEINGKKVNDIFIKNGQPYKIEGINGLDVAVSFVK